jgi:hypothetical protein
MPFPDSPVAGDAPWSFAARPPAGFHSQRLHDGCESTRGQWHRVRLTEKYGRVFPSLEGLAHLAMCCRQSVVTAIADLERLGFVSSRSLPRASSDFLTPSPPGEKATTCQYQAGQPCTGDGAGHL